MANKKPFIAQFKEQKERARQKLQDEREKIVDRQQILKDADRLKL